jgi:hypothetical protein
MTPEALIMMLVTEIGVTAFTVYYFYKVLFGIKK